MFTRSFLASSADVAVKCLLVVAGIIGVPVPSVLLYLVAADASSNQYADDGPFLAALIVLIIAVLAYFVLIVPMIWRKRFVGAGRTSAA